jgi:acetyltransferase-like isoleucine patch superfamily enzyme
MKHLIFLKSLLELPKAELRNAVLRARLRKQYPTCQFFPGISIDKQSMLGSYNVLFDNVTILASAIGDHTYVQKNSIICDAEIGKFCSIAMGVSIGLPQHSISTVSSHPAFYLKNTPLAKTYSDRDAFTTSKKTIIGHDVWIGQNAIIMNGLRIGIGAVIGAGSVVTRDIPEYAVVGGVPAKIIRYRFDEKIRNDLLESKWWDMSEEWLEKNYLLFDDPVKLLEFILNID